MNINWIHVCKEIRDIPGGLAALRVLQAHGLTHIVRIDAASGTSTITNSNSIESVIDTAHRER
jgi:hypothetical protein